MDPVQARFQPGGLDCSKLENFADNLLLLPKLMWNKYLVSYNANYSNIEVKNAKSFTNNIENLGLNLGVKGIAGKLVSGLVSVTYALGSIVATPLLVVGLALKEVSIREDKAKNHHMLLVNAPKLVELQKGKVELIQPRDQLIDRLYLLKEEGNEEELEKTIKASMKIFSEFLLISNKKKKSELKFEILLNQQNLLV